MTNDLNVTTLPNYAGTRTVNTLYTGKPKAKPKARKPAKKRKK